MGEVEGELRIWEVSYETIETGQAGKVEVLNYLEKGSRNRNGIDLKAFKL